MSDTNCISSVRDFRVMQEVLVRGGDEDTPETDYTYSGISPKWLYMPPETFPKDEHVPRVISKIDKYNSRVTSEWIMVCYSRRYY